MKKIKSIYDGEANTVKYYKIENAKFITLAKLVGRYKKGDIFNVYTESGSKYGCEWDGVSIETSIEKLENIIENE